PAEPRRGAAAGRRAELFAAAAVGQHRGNRGGQRDGVSLGHDEAVLAVVDHAADAAGSGGDDGRPRCERLEDRVGETVDIAAVVAYRRYDRHVCGRPPGGDRVPADGAEELDTIAAATAPA